MIECLGESRKGGGAKWRAGWQIENNHVIQEKRDTEANSENRIDFPSSAGQKPRIGLGGIPAIEIAVLYDDWDGGVSGGGLRLVRVAGVAPPWLEWEGGEASVNKGGGRVGYPVSWGSRGSRVGYMGMTCVTAATNRDGIVTFTLSIIQLFYFKVPSIETPIPGFLLPVILPERAV